MPKSNPVTPVNPAEEKWKQQVRLACVQAVSARAVSSNAAYDPTSIVSAATALANFVLQCD